LNIFLLDKDLLHVVNNFQHKGSDMTCMLVCLLSDQKVEELMQRYNLGFVLSPPVVKHRNEIRSLRNMTVTTSRD